MKKFLVFLIFLISCAITNTGELRQNIVSENEIKLMSYFREGMYYFKSSKYLDSVQSFYKALMIEDNPKIQYNLSLALERLGDNDSALSIIKKLYSYYPDDINYKMAYARMLDLVGNKESAIDIYNEILGNLNSKDVVKDYRYKVFRRLSDLYFKIGQEEEAICYSHLAFNERNSNDEFVRHMRFLLSVNVESNKIDSMIKEFSKGDEKKIKETVNADANANVNEGIIQGESIKECRLESIQAWGYLLNFKENYDKIIGIIDRSKECLSNKDSYYAALLLFEEIVKKYDEAISTEKKESSEDESSDDSIEGEGQPISESTLLMIPAMAYQYIEYFSKEYNIVKSGALN